MNRLEHLLTIVGEESVEVAQRASKAARFGLREVQPGQDLDNRARLLGEFADLCGALELLDESIIDDLVHELRPQIDAKKAKVEKFLLYSREVGTLETSRVKICIHCSMEMPANVEWWCPQSRTGHQFA